MDTYPHTPRAWLPASWQGQWTPVRIRVSDVFMILWAATFQAWVRGLDYLTGAEPHGRGPNSLAVIERAMPIRAWGAIFTVGAIVLAVGMLLRRHAMVWGGHSVLMVAYWSLFVGLILQALSAPWFDGIRSAMVLLTVAVLHSIAWWRTGPRPDPIRAAALRPADLPGGDRS